ncbi:hypothetical protein Rhe02_12230 [Rhizocola hellebori]|uniref:N-acetyltransferase domain-containing protein n=1 Tax=Rhizocola hellebori TaxID=1392758 RepID=A0A8J3Q4C9_9ACTN|nr:GNAT family N-acetyltransferase [Rhizocola hellebori]GIH03156.1 hypothetical protein Rhe02_12230 [Rhizocola hellebori]
MTIVRPAQPTEIPALTEYSGDGERNAATAGYLTSLLESGCTKPEWCLVAEEPGAGLVGNVVLWTAPGHPEPIDIVLLDATDASVGGRLLERAGELARSLGAQRQGHCWDSPAQAPQFQRDPQLRAQLLADAGFAVDRDGERFAWRTADGMPELDPRLTWRPLTELGEAPFVDLLEDILANTADALLRAAVAEQGLRKAAEAHFRECLEYDHQPHWYEIGYDPDGTAAALSLPARNAAFPIIGMVGVATAHRGKGYATSVVARGTHLLAISGATEIRGDCDRSNVAMVKAFARCGYQNFANRRMYSRAL